VSGRGQEKVGSVSGVEPGTIDDGKDRGHKSDNGSLHCDETGGEMVEGLVCAADRGLDLEQYLAGRQIGISHDALMRASEMRGGMSAYVTAVKQGVTDDEVAWVWEWGADLAEYTEARKLGSSHAEIVGIFESYGRDGNGRFQGFDDYVEMLSMGFSHLQILDEWDQEDAIAEGRRLRRGGKT